MTRAGVQERTARLHNYPAVPFLLLGAVSVIGVLVPFRPPRVTGGPLNPGDVAWMLTATGLVLLRVTDLIIPLRVTPDQEAIGLDLSQHGESFGERPLPEASAPRAA